jgi:hypothetical protein
MRMDIGRAAVQAVSRRIPTAPARVRYHVKSSEICGWQSGTGTGFIRIFLSSLPSLIPQNGPYSCVIQGWYSRPISGRRTKWTQSHPPRETLKKNLRTDTISRLFSLCIERQWITLPVTLPDILLLPLHWAPPRRAFRSKPEIPLRRLATPIPENGKRIMNERGSSWAL